MTAQVGLFEAMGLLRVPAFLSPTECDNVIEVAGASTGEPAKVFDQDDVEYVKPESRSTTLFKPLGETKAMLFDRLEERRTEFGDVFGAKPLSITPITVLRYDEGDFFRRHQDATPGKQSMHRVISLILMLSPNLPETDGGYDGGELTVYPELLQKAALDDDEAEGIGLDLRLEQGELLVFEAEMFHEVKKVVAGRRYSVVSWLSTRPA